MLSRFAIKETKTMFVVNIPAMLIEYERTLELAPTPLSQVIKWQIQHLGYVDYINPKVGKNMVIVTELDTKYSPKFKAVCINNGQVCELRVATRPSPRNKDCTTFKEIPFEDGDILEMIKCAKKPRVRKTENGWEDVPNEFCWHLQKYRLTNDKLGV